MALSWIPLQGIPAHGKEFVLTDQSIWTDPVREFGMDCRILEPLRATLFLLPREEGVLARGRLTGKVAVPCSRCAEDAEVVIDQGIESFEAYPQAPERAARGKGRDTGGGGRAEKGMNGLPADMRTDAGILRHTADGRGLEMDLAALAWQEFSLALPVMPLCAPGCKGLCPKCGANRNQGACSCVPAGHDPRLAALLSPNVAKD